SSNMAARILTGGSLGLSPESFWKNTNQGNLMPACRNTPAEAAAKASHTHIRCRSAAASAIIDFEMKPDVSGNDEMASAPTTPQIQVKGIVRNKPPRSVHFDLPVIIRTDPADISSRAL